MGNGAHQAGVVVALHASLGFRQPGLHHLGLMAVIEYGGIEGLFGRKMAEDDGFGNARRRCDFLGGGASESLAGEEIERRFQQLPAAVGSGQAAAGSVSDCHASYYK